MTYMTSRQIAESLKNKIRYHKTQRDLSRELGVSGSYLCDFLSGNREAGPLILKALGFDKTPRYKKSKP